MGKRCFPYVVGTICAITTIFTIVTVGKIHGLGDNSEDLVALWFLALGSGLLVGILLVKAIWIIVGLVGIVAGSALGLLIYGASLVTSG